MATPTHSDVREALLEFKQMLAPELRPQLSLSELYRVRSTTGQPVHWPSSYQSVWTVLPTYGVYCHFDEDDRLLYVGKAVDLGIRLAAYYKHRDYPCDTSCLVIDERLDAGGFCGTRVVIFPDQIRCLSPALEWFLIERLNPPLNKQGRTAGPPRSDDLAAITEASP